MRAAACAIAMGATLAGCGGPSEAQRLGSWQSRADADCRRAEERIAERGQPAHVRDLDRVTVRAVGDVRTAIRAIAGRPLPEGSEARVRPFVDALRRVEPRLDELVSAGEFADATRLLVAVDKLERPAAELERAARRAGLRVCARAGFARRVSDAMLTPLFVERLLEIETGLRRDLTAFAGEQGLRTFGDVHEHLFDMATVLDDTQDAFGGLYPPTPAVDALNRHNVALRREAELLNRTAKKVGRLVVVPLPRLYRRLGAMERRRAALLNEILAAAGSERSVPLPRSGEQS